MEKKIRIHLSQTDLFDNLTEEQLDKIAAITEAATLPKEIVLIEEKETSDALYIVATGSVEIWLNPEMIASESQTAEAGFGCGTDAWAGIWRNGVSGPGDTLSNCNHHARQHLYLTVTARKTDRVMRQRY